MAKQFTIPKELRKTVMRARKLGWSLTVCGSGHYKLHKRGYQPVYISCSASDRRTPHNLRRDMRKAGVPF